MTDSVDAWYNICALGEMLGNQPPTAKTDGIPENILSMIEEELEGCPFGVLRQYIDDRDSVSVPEYLAYTDTWWDRLFGRPNLNDQPIIPDEIPTHFEDGEEVK